MGNWLQQISPMLRIIDHHPEAAEWVEPLRTLYDHELMLFGQGDGVVTIDGVAYPCPAHSYLIIPPGALESSYIPAAQVWERHWVHFDWVYQPGQELLPVSATYPQQPSAVAIHWPPPFVPRAVLRGPIPAPRRTFELFARLESRWRNGSAHDRLTCRALLLELLIELLDTRDDLSAGQQGHDQLLRRVRRALEELSLLPMCDMPPLQSYLPRFGYSHAHTTRVFQQGYGMPPLAYINALRVERAKLLLQDTSLPIAQVALQVGVDDPGYFTRLFRNYTAMSPSAFAQSWRKEQNTDISSAVCTGRDSQLVE
ncbi:MAG TPA: AraC family transcriptional regulator [Armatimonadota bacterium]